MMPVVMSLTAVHGQLRATVADVAAARSFHLIDFPLRREIAWTEECSHCSKILGQERGTSCLKRTEVRAARRMACAQIVLLLQQTRRVAQGVAAQCGYFQLSEDHGRWILGKHSFDF